MLFLVKGCWSQSQQGERRCTPWTSHQSFTELTGRHREVHMRKWQCPHLVVLIQSEGRGVRLPRINVHNQCIFKVLKNLKNYKHNNDIQYQSWYGEPFRKQEYMASIVFLALGFFQLLGKNLVEKSKCLIMFTSLSLTLCFSHLVLDR